MDTHQSVHVVAHVPEGDEGQSESTAVLQGDLVLPGHHRGHSPPGTPQFSSFINTEVEQRSLKPAGVIQSVDRSDVLRH